MPCYRCGTRQVDPDRGSSPWQRGVLADRQVLICPRCQSGRDWRADLDKCPVCRSAHLVRRLGEAECRDCGAVGTSVLPAGHGAVVSNDVAAGLAEEVEQALARVLRRAPGRRASADAFG
jgi:hypothetical protein